MQEEEFAKTIGKRIKALRIEKQFTQIQLSDKLGIEDSALRRIESGRTNPTLKTLVKISEALGINLSELVSKEADN